MLGSSPPPDRPIIDAVFTMLPPLPGMWRAAARAHWNAPVRLTATTASQSASGSSSEGLRIGAAGVVDQDVDAAVRLRDGGERTIDRRFIGHVEHLRVRMRHSLRAASSAAASRSSSTTVAPASVINSAHASPMPCAPPVIAATWPSTRNARRPALVRGHKLSDGSKSSSTLAPFGSWQNSCQVPAPAWRRRSYFDAALVEARLHRLQAAAR